MLLKIVLSVRHAIMEGAKVVRGKCGAYQLLGNMTEDGEIFWEVFVKTHK